MEITYMNECEENESYLFKAYFYTINGIILALAFVSMFLIFRYFKETAKIYEIIRMAYQSSEGSELLANRALRHEKDIK
jgi:hypothetical protein